MSDPQKGRTAIAWVSVAILSASLWLALVSFASAEQISSFAADITVGAAGELLVVETIDYDFESAERRGIYRNLRADHPQPASAWYKDRYIAYEVRSVNRNGNPEPFEVSGSRDIEIRIGDPDEIITGDHRYTITYTVAGAIARYDTGTEVYWNVTGNEWSVPIQAVTVTLRGREDVLLKEAQACYAGALGATKRCNTSLTDQVASFSHSALAPGEGMTVAQRVELPERPVVLERVNGIWVWLVAALAWFIGLGVLLWRWRRMYYYTAPVVTQYEPYQDCKPMFTGVLFDTRLDSRDITAGIIYLAEQGFLRIEQTDRKVFFLFETTDYEVTLERPLEEVETAFQRELLAMFDLTSVGQTVSLGDIKKDQRKLRRNAKIKSKLQKAVKADLREQGFIEKNQHQTRIITGYVLLIVLLTLSLQFVDEVSVPIILGVVSLPLISILPWALFGLERRTRKGYEARYHLRGFKDFLCTTEADRYTFHNAPDKNPETFMRFLPYAVAFGVEKEWATVFADINIPEPNWYAGRHTAPFNATAFTRDIGAFSAAFAAASTVNGSGSSGGGFSGGGAGGGGGGSW